MKHDLLSFGFLATLSLLLLSCNQGQGISEDADAVIAQVGNRKLHNSELKQIIYPAASRVDSTSLANAYIDQWIRDNLLMQEASRVFASDFEVEKLVDDYREKLLKFKLEEKILTEKYDTTVTEDQLFRFYERNRERFVLDQAIIRCWRASLPIGTKRTSEFRKLWSKGDEKACESFLLANATEFDLSEELWQPWQNIEEWCAMFDENQVKTVKELRKKDKNAEFYLKVFEVLDKGDIAPLVYIKYQLRLMILHKRKQDVVDSYKDELYEQALESNLVKTF